MLVLTRKLMEKLYIGDEICVTVVRLEGGQVRLGIDAPRHIPVVRAELAPLPTTAPAAPTEAPSGGLAHPGEAAGRLRIPPGEARGIGIRRHGPSR
jgi:carbon storage regulator